VSRILTFFALGISVLVALFFVTNAFVSFLAGVARGVSFFLAGCGAVNAWFSFTLLKEKM
jgi:hypothetical protein